MTQVQKSRNLKIMKTNFQNSKNSTSKKKKNNGS